jgi:SagB-type dehydrogenase family enzyme
MVLEKIRRPYLVAGGYHRQQDWFFFTPGGTIKLDGCNAALFVLIPLLDGNHSIDDILNQLSDYCPEDMMALLSLLAKHHIITDVNRIYSAFYAYARYPSLFSEGLSDKENTDLFYDTSHLSNPKGSVFQCQVNRTPLSSMLHQRTSVRRFFDQSLDQEALLNLMWTLYGKQYQQHASGNEPTHPSFTVPSGGGLYPLSLYLILFKKCGQILPGTYLWHKDSSLLELIESNQDLETVKAHFIGVDARCLETCTGTICVVADFERMARKYGNHAYNLVMLEAGHVMQNAYLFCSQHDIGLVEVYGFLASSLSEWLVIDFPDKAPVIAAVFGNIQNA